MAKTLFDCRGGTNISLHSHENDLAIALQSSATMRRVTTLIKSNKPIKRITWSNPSKETNPKTTQLRSQRLTSVSFKRHNNQSGFSLPSCLFYHTQTKLSRAACLDFSCCGFTSLKVKRRAITCCDQKLTFKLRLTSKLTVKRFTKHRKTCQIHMLLLQMKSRC